MIVEYMSILIVAWGIGSTIYGLYLSHQNNKKYNKRIVELLSDIKEEIKNEHN